MMSPAASRAASMLTKSLSTSRLVAPGKSILKARQDLSASLAFHDGTSVFFDDSEAFDDAKKRSVRFHEVCIRHHPMILGDNPAVSSGAPLTLDWDVIDEEAHTIEHYEYRRSWKGEKRRGRKKLAFSVNKRAKLLLGAGFSLDDIGQATLEVEQIKRSRFQSLRSVGWGQDTAKAWAVLSGTVESTGRTLRKVDILPGVLASGATATIDTTNKMVNNMIDTSGKAAYTVVDKSGHVIKTSAGLVATGMERTAGAFTDVGMAVFGGMTTTGKVMASGVTSTGNAIASGVTTTGKAVVSGVEASTQAVASAASGVTKSSKRNSTRVVASAKRAFSVTGKRLSKMVGSDKNAMTPSAACIKASQQGNKLTASEAFALVEERELGDWQQ